MKLIRKMTREEMWEEFESQLKCEIRTPITMSYNESIKLAEMGIKDVVARWKKRLEQDLLKQNIVNCENFKFDEWDIGDKKAELWVIKGRLQIRHRGTIHNVDFPVLPKREQGEWIIERDCEGKTRTCICPKCGEKTGEYTWKNPNYCSNCGMEMIQSQESEEE